MSDNTASPTPTKRTVVLHFRTTEDEKAAIEQRALEYSGRVGKLVSMSDYIRRAAIGCKEAA
jgi:hypothetical protein